MSGERETILNALLAALQAGLATPGRVIERNLDLPEEVPAEGVVILRDGQLEQVGTVLSPLRYEFINHADLELFVAEDDAAARDAAMSALRGAVVTLIAGDRTLGGLVDWLDAAEAEEQGIPIDGAPGLKAVLLTVDAHFVSDSPLG